MSDAPFFGGELPWRVSLEEARAAPIPPGARSSLLMRHGSMLLRFYRPREVDLQQPHEQDEIYLVATGAGVFVCAGDRVPFGPGDALFAPAGATHRFEEFSDDFAAWVVFYGPKGGERPG
jgi:mannose-6-phosphate isomerase-like protein (cupin superfamily)